MKKNRYFLIYALILISIYSTIGINEVMAHNSTKEKVVFLTFDDGPSPNNTPEILKILKDNDVKATFFVIGTSVESYPHVAKRLYKEGMCILPHTYSHNYGTIYNNSESYFNDLNKCISSIKNITGEEVIHYTRLPGGSDNLVSNSEVLRTIRNKLNAKGIDYIDWNVSSGDAEGGVVAVNILNNNIKYQCTDLNLAVILMHDSYYKTTTVESLDSTIKHLKAQGYKFKKINEMTPNERNNLIKMRVINRR
ncbi:polysaccharide deacetylase [Clostridium sp. MSJ-11]|uniref:Polysaccharide deacetylase n=1 Tax=Clostridium mobile TaxID=2841512 RepID=A0ABS6EM08_9CLOT|nr:polysaccharide deacetylase [Clostridium mobile]